MRTSLENQLPYHSGLPPDRNKDQFHNTEITISLPKISVVPFWFQFFHVLKSELVHDYIWHLMVRVSSVGLTTSGPMLRKFFFLLRSFNSDNGFGISAFDSTRVTLEPKTRFRDQNHLLIQGGSRVSTLA